jgi:hypothetical protein
VKTVIPAIIGVTGTISKSLRQYSCNAVYPRNMVCFRYINVNTMHKGDNKDDDNDNEEEKEKKNAIKGIHVYLFFLILIQMFILLQAYSVYVVLQYLASKTKVTPGCTQ